jgi:arylsulfatase A-like enzyme
MHSVVNTFLILSILFSFASCTEKEQTPNLLIVFPDQMRGQAMGFVGEEPVITPNLDKFASNGLVFNQAVSNYPVCSPFRGMLMTGKFPVNNKVLSNCTNLIPLDNELQKNDVTWSDILHEKEYSLGYIGKWHLERPYEPYIDCANNKGRVKWNEWTPPDRRHGFDFWYAYNTYDYHMHPLYWNTTESRNGFHYVDQWGPEHEADIAVKYIHNKDGKFRKKGKPFALVVSMNPPHMPYNAVPQKYKDIYKDSDTLKLFKRPDIPPANTKWGEYYRKNIRNYYAMITGVDEQFGRILKALKDQGLDKNTIVLFTSDHGNCLGIHNMISKNNHYEESMRIPFILKWPDKLSPGQTNLLISSPDIYPTLLDLMGFKNDIPEVVEGTSFADYIRSGKGNKPSSQMYIWMKPGHPETGRRGVRTEQYTLVIDKTPDAKEEIILHNNQADPYQMKNIAGKHPEIVSELVKNELIPWLRKTNDPFIENLKKY